VFCSHCGQQIPDDSVVCARCGKSVTPLRPPGADVGLGAQKLRQVARTFLVLGILNILGGLMAAAVGWLCGGLSILLGIWEIVNAILYWSTPPKVTWNPTYIAVLEIVNIACGPFWSLIGGILNLNRLKSPEVKAYLAALQGGQASPAGTGAAIARHAPASQSAPVAQQARRRRWTPIAIAGGGLIFLVGLLLGMFLVAGQNSATPIYEEAQYYYIALLICPAPLLLVGLVLLGAGIYARKLESKRDVQNLIKALSTKKKGTVRRDAARVLGELKDVRAVEGLIAALNDGDTAVRQTAARALSEFRDTRAVEPFIAALNDSDLAVRQTAARALSEFKDTRAVEPFIAALNDSDTAVRQVAARALSEFKDTRAVEPFIAALNDSDAAVRQVAAKALSEFKDARAVEPFIAALNDSDTSVRRDAAEALGELKDARAVEPLITALEDGDASVRQVAAKALSEFKDTRAVEPLIAALNDSDTSVRRDAAEALGKLRDARAVEPLMAAFEDPTKYVGQAAAGGLIQIGVPAVASLIAALAKPDKAVQRAVVDTLVQIGSPAVELLITALHDGREGVRRAAVEALGNIRDARAVDPLSATLTDKSEDMREAVVRALARMGSAQAADPLAAALNDESPRVRRATADALHELGWQPGNNELGATYWIERGEWDRCTEMGVPAVGPLLVALKKQIEEAARQQPGGATHLYAAEALLKIGAPAAERLVAALNDDEEEGTCQAAALALGLIGDPRAVEPLVAALKEGNSVVRRAAAEALGQIGDPRAVVPLTAALGDKSEPVQKAAAQALARNVDGLVTALAHQDSHIREEAAWALSQVASRDNMQAVEPLIDFLGKASSFSSITSALEALGKIGDVRAVDRLKSYASVSDPDMRYWAIWALAEIGGPQTTDVLTKALEDEAPEIRQVADKALKKAEAARKPAAPPRPRTTLYAFLAQAPGGMMGFQQGIVLLASDEEIKRTIRDRSGYSDAEVVIVPPEEWNPPALNSVSQQELSAKFPMIFDAVQRGLARRGVPWVHPQALINDGLVLPNPASGRVYFVYRIDG